MTIYFDNDFSDDEEKDATDAESCVSLVFDNDFSDDEEEDATLHATDAESVGAPQPAAKKAKTSRW